MRAGELETSILLATYPDYLRDGWHTADQAANDRRYLTTLGIDAYTPTGGHRLPIPSHRNQRQQSPPSRRPQRRVPHRTPHRPVKPTIPPAAESTRNGL